MSTSNKIVVVTMAGQKQEANFLKLNTLSDFVRGYITAAFFTFDEVEPPGGVDYRDTGCAEELFEKLAVETLVAMIADCEKFLAENKLLLSKCGDDEQNGHDFWFTRNGHGVGFWDRGYDKGVADAISRAARATGERNIYTGDDGKIYQQ